MMIALLVLAGFNSCEKEDTGPFIGQAEVVSAGVSSMMESMYVFSLLHKAVHDTALANNGSAAIDSSMVSVQYDSVTGIRHYTFDYGTGQISPDWKTRSGKITATLAEEFTVPGAVITAHFQDYRVDDSDIQGGIDYTNTGDFVSGQKMMMMSADITASESGQYLVSLQSNREIAWTEGFDKPENYSAHEFTFSGDSQMTYTAPSGEEISAAGISSAITTAWEVRLKCSKLVKSGENSFDLSYNNVSEIITGTFVDSDMDNCSDKVMLKNRENFGYPFYL